MSARIAVAHVPCFGLQAIARLRRDLEAAALVLEGEGSLRGRVAEASRKARASGIVEGLTLTQARASCPGLIVLTPDAGAEAQARHAIHEALLLISPVVEWAGGGTFCLDAGGLSMLHGSEIALLARAVQVLEDAGFLARAACSSSRLISSLAARSRPGPCVVELGREESFLSPLPVTLLPLGEEALRRLELLGIRTLGQMARLPSDGLADRFGREAARWQRLLRGEDPAPLLPLRPARGPRVVRELEAPVGGIEAVTFLLKACCEDLCDQLESRGTLAARLELAMALDDPPGGADVRVLEPSRPVASARTLLSLCRLELLEQPARKLAAPLLGLGLSALEEIPARGVAGELFGASLDHEALAAALDRVRALLGSQDVVTPASRDSHRREARVGWAPFRLDDRQAEARTPTRRQASPRGVEEPLEPETSSGAPVEERLLERPVPLLVRLPRSEQAGALHVPASARAELGLPEHVAIVAAKGPTRLCGEWWDGGADVDRDEWLLTGADGGAYRAVRDRRTHEWALLGMLD